MVSGALNHMNGRVYDPAIGRFLSPDPLVQAPNNTQSYNRYSYVFNNPLSYTDPTGYSTEQEITDIHVDGEYTGDQGCGGCSFEIDTGGVGVSGINPSLINGVLAINHNGVAYIPDKATQRKAKRRARATGKDQVIMKNGSIKSVRRKASAQNKSVFGKQVRAALTTAGGNYKTLTKGDLEKSASRRDYSKAWERLNQAVEEVLARLDALANEAEADGNMDLALQFLGARYGIISARVTLTSRGYASTSYSTGNMKINVNLINFIFLHGTKSSNRGGYYVDYPAGSLGLQYLILHEGRHTQDINRFDTTVNPWIPYSRERVEADADGFILQVYP